MNSTKSLFSLFVDADLAVQLVMLILFAASLWSWTIIIYKWTTFTAINSKFSHFEKIFRQSRLEKIFANLSPTSICMIEKILINAFSKKKDGMNMNQISASIITDKNRFMESLEDKMSYLATISSATPFIGLFGTVWGIMHSFQSIAASKNTSLAVVAPGIAEALLATALGLVAAIPALIFYNILNTKLRGIESSLENFTIELHSRLTDRE